MVQPIQFNLQYCRDIQMFWSLNQIDALEATLVGRVIRRNSKGGIIFFSVCDPSGVMECKADRSKFSSENWDTVIKAIRKGDRISVHGLVETQMSSGDRQPILDIRLAEKSLLGDLPPEGVDWNYSAISSGFFIARLKRSVASELIKRRFEEFEPRYIHNLKPPGPLEPLRVVFPGYGSPAYLLVSPIPDLRAVSLTTGIPKVFSVVRAYSQTIRDGYTSAESVVIGLVIVDSQAHQLVDLCVQLIYGCFGDYCTMANNWSEYAQIASWVWDDLPASSMTITPVSRPTILKLADSAFALAWPKPLAEDGRPQEPLLVAEGNIRNNEIGVVEGSAIIHIERMARAIRDDLTLRT